MVYKNAVDTNTIFDLVHLLLQNVWLCILNRLGY